MKSVIRPTETSIERGEPIELYIFNSRGIDYLYTSAAKAVSLRMNGRSLTFQAETIQRENIKPGSAGGASACVVKVSKDNSVAKLYEGAPPEDGTRLTVYRLHGTDIKNYDAVMRAEVTQAHWTGSECELTCTMDAWLSKELPNGMFQYYCGHSIFDHNCGLDKKAFETQILIDKVDDLTIYSTELAAYPNDYFTGGRLYYQTSVRMIAQHAGNTITLKYPCVSVPRNIVTIVPGCDQLFATCAKRYHNTLHFSGIPYCPPTDPEKNPTGQGAYWIDSLVVQRDTKGFVGTISGV